MQGRTAHILSDLSIIRGLKQNYKGGNRILKEDATLQDTMREFPGLVHRNMEQTQEVAGRLKGSDLEQTCRNIFEFFNDHRHFQFKKDRKGREQIRTFSRLVMDKKGDCDCFVNSISAILLNLGIKHYLRITKYKESWFEHIYIIVPLDQTYLSPKHPIGKYITLDRVAGIYNYEVPFSNKRDKAMILEELNGLEGSGYDLLQSLTGEISGLGAGVSARAKKAAQDAGKSLEQWQKDNRAAFIAKHGMTPEEYSSKVRKQVNQAQQQNAQSDVEKMKKELYRRGVNVPPNAKRADLLRLLKANPGPAKGSQLLNKLNKFNPATLALRAGVLLAMKINMYKISQNIRYAYLTPGEARKMKLDLGKYYKLFKVKQKVEKIYFGAGGDRSKFRDAVLGGKGNRDGFIAYEKSLAGLGETNSNSLREILGDDLYLSEGLFLMNKESSLNGLGEIATGVALSAAAAALGAVAAVIKSIGDAKAQGKDGFSTASDALQKASDGLTTVNTSLTRPDTTLPATQEGTRETGNNGQRVLDNEKGFFVRNWIPISIGTLVLIGGGYYGYQKIQEKKAKPVSGTPKLKRNPAKAKTKPKSPANKPVPQKGKGKIKPSKWM